MIHHKTTLRERERERERERGGGEVSGREMGLARAIAKPRK